MTKPINPNLSIPASFANEGKKTDFADDKIQSGFNENTPDVLCGDNLNKLIDDIYKGLTYSTQGVSDLYKGAILYDTSETYTDKSIVFNIDSDGKTSIYKSLSNNNAGNSLSDTNKWKEISLGTDFLNNPYSLFDSKYSDHELNNVSWLQSSGQWNSGSVYVDAYDKLLKVYNGTETVKGLSIKLSTEEYTDYDFVLNTADETFRLPLRNGSEGMFGNIPVVGNGMTLGLTDGTNNVGLHAWNSVNYFIPAKDAYGTAVGTASSPNNPGPQLDYGVTTDPTKSGLVTDISRAIVPDGWKLYYYIGETVQNANLIDAGRIGEQLAGKQDKCIHIIDTYVNGRSGYRIWSDGYCKQWGTTVLSATTASISYLKTFLNNDYALINSKIYSATNWTGSDYILSKTQNGFTAYAYSAAARQLCWVAIGYLAEGEY